MGTNSRITGITKDVDTVEDGFVAGSDEIVMDPVTGVNRQIYAGQFVPEDLVDAYKAAGGSEGEEGEESDAAQSKLYRGNASGYGNEANAKANFPEDADATKPADSVKAKSSKSSK